MTKVDCIRMLLTIYEEGFIDMESLMYVISDVTDGEYTTYNEVVSRFMEE